MNYNKIESIQNKKNLTDNYMGEILGISGPGYKKMLLNKTCRVEYLEKQSCFPDR